MDARLAKWILGGLAAGAVVIGIAIAAYAIGYHRGEHHHRAAAHSLADFPRRRA